MIDSLFFVTSKIAWAFFSPDSLLLILLLFATVLIARKKYKTARLVISIVFAFTALISIFPFAQALLIPLENRFELNPKIPNDITGIIVLSGGVNSRISAMTGQVQANEQIDREIAMISLQEKYPESRIYYAGGSSSIFSQNFEVADTVEALMESIGIESNRIEYERNSRNTFESATNLFDLARPNENENWILLTSAFHMPRSVGVFCSIGWPVIAYPVDLRSEGRIRFSPNMDVAENMSLLKVATKEWIGLLAYRITGKIDNLFPSSC